MKNIVSIVISGVFLYACSGNGQSAETTDNNTAASSSLVNLTPDQLKNAGIVSEIPGTAEMHAAVRLNGVIDVPPGSSVIVSVPFGGYLKSSRMLAGMKVAKGQVLAVVEDQQYVQLQQDYLTARNRMKLFEADYNRQKSLNETKASSDKTVQQAQSDYLNEKILLRSLAEKLRIAGISPESLNENTISRAVSLRSPISGYVTSVNADVGKYINPADELFAITDPAKTQLRLTVFEKDAARIVKGQKISFTVNNDPGKKYSATVNVISPYIGENRATVVYAEPDALEGILLPGVFVSAEVRVDAQNVVALPSGAVVEWENAKYVFADLGGGKYRMAPVKTGMESGEMTEIVSGLPEGKIVIRNAYTLLMKLKNQE